jgi:hypothetical protein
LPVCHLENKFRLSVRPWLDTETPPMPFAYSTPDYQIAVATLQIAVPDTTPSLAGQRYGSREHPG